MYYVSFSNEITVTMGFLSFAILREYTKDWFIGTEYFFLMDLHNNTWKIFWILTFYNFKTCSAINYYKYELTKSSSASKWLKKFPFTKCLRNIRPDKYSVNLFFNFFHVDCELSLTEDVFTEKKSAYLW